MAVVIREEGKKYFKLHRVFMPDGSLFEFTETEKSNAETAGLQNANLSPTNVASNNSIHQNEPVVNTSDKKSSDKEQYDLDPEAVEREAKRLTPKTEKTEKKKAESSTSGIKTGSAEAGRYARGMRNEFGLDKKFEAAIRSKLESLEEVFIKGDREAYVEEYKKRVEEIFDIVRREGVVEVATDNSYRGFLGEALYFKSYIEHLFLWLVLFLGVWWELAFGGSCYNTFYFYLSRVFKSQVCVERIFNGFCGYMPLSQGRERQFKDGL